MLELYGRTEAAMVEKSVSYLLMSSQVLLVDGQAGTRLSES